MKDKLRYFLVPIIYLTLAWLLADADFRGDIFLYVFTAAFLLNVVIVIFVKNKIIYILTTLVLNIAAGIYDFNYTLFFLHPIMLIIAEKEVVEILKNKNKKTFDTLCGACLTLCGIFCIVQLLSSIFLYKENDNGYLIIYYLLPVFLIMAVFAFLIKNRNKDVIKEFKISKNTAGSLKSIYVVSFVSLISDASTAFFTSEYVGLQRIKIWFFGWFIYIVYLFLSEDPFVGYLLLKLKASIEKFVEKPKVSK